MATTLTSGTINTENHPPSSTGLPVKYRPTDVHIIFGGFPLHHGISSGTFFTAARNKSTWRGVKGCDGEGIRIRTNDFSARGTLTLRQGSATNDFLSAHILADEISGMLAVPMYVKHIYGRSTYVSSFTTIEMPTDAAFGTNEGDNIWTFLSDNWQPFTGGFNPFIQLANQP